MIQFLVAAPCSGSGKTTLTCALLAALKRRGQDPCSFKSGPDYIDPMFHRAVLGVESHNLDLFFSEPETVRALYAQAAAGHGAAVCEGAMGFYDGLGGVSDTASAWHLADTLGLPVLLVVQPRGASLTLAAQINGLNSSAPPAIWRASCSMTAPPICMLCWLPCWNGRPACRCWAICPTCRMPPLRAAT